LIAQAYTLGDSLGLAVWCHDQAGPYQAVPQPGASWQPQGEPVRQPSEYIRQGTAKLLTLFHPADGRVIVQGVTRCPNSVLHPWLKSQLRAILAQLPKAADGLGPSGLPPLGAATTEAMWRRWQAELSVRFTLPQELPPLRMLLVLDNLAGHKTPAFVLWLVAQGIMPLYTPLGGSWLNMAESIQRILARRALSGQSPETPERIIHDLEAVAAHWNQAPTPFVWGGKRATRRARAHQRRHALGGSGACTHRPVSRRPSKLQEWLRSYQVTH
jgi:hypothetical protein